MSVLLYGGITLTLMKYKDAVCCFEHSLEAALYEIAVVRPLTSHLTNHPSKMSKTCWELLKKLGQTHKQSYPTDSHTWTHQCCLTSKNLFISSMQTQDAILRIC